MRTTPDLTATEPGPWPARAALASALFAVPLVLFGGSVTTLGAGMAVDGWLVAEGHFLLFFPAEKWFRDMPTFVEHTHRLWGALVGLCALACVILAFRRGRGTRLERAGALAVLGAVCLQGLLGGLRVLWDDLDLAVLHGALAQLVFALLCANAVLFSRGWRAPLAGVAPLAARALASAALITLVVLYAQVVLGAWYRHGLRPEPVAGHALRFALHGAGAVLVLASVAWLARRGGALRASGALPAGLGRALRSLPVLLLVQIVLGGLAWAGFRPGVIGPAEWALSVAHVLGGALLLADVAVIALWAVRLRAHGAPSPVGTPAQGAVAGGAR